ncbi:MAG: peptidase U32 family protein [Promethearchaeota archaeon]
MNSKHSVKSDFVELLAPAKNFMALKASGPYADAVYFGVENFNMRMKADNFRLEDLPKVADRCHNPKDPRFRHRKAFLTTNILIYEDELPFMENVIQAAKDAGIDAVIVHDLASIQLAKKIGIPFHISTQCNVSNSMSAQFYESLGAERIILARECSLKQIKAIIPKLKTADIETFMHGAMCSSISGRCYLSQTIAGTAEKSANRGLCMQPCRGKWTLTSQNGHEFIYDGKRIFNSRDLCMINYVPDMIKAGIKSFKIEGRMRHPHYVETVSRVYREAIDAYIAGHFEESQKKQRWITQLKKVYNRGFTTGFFFNQATIKDSQLNSPANMSHYRYIEMGRIKESYPSGAAKIVLKNGTLNVGDEIIVMSSDSAYETYFTQKIQDIRVDGKEVQNSGRATETKPITITTKLIDKTNEKEIDVVYKFTEETYRALYKSKKKRKSNYRLS